MIYLWRNAAGYPEKLYGVYDRAHSPDRFLFKKGHRLNELDLRPIFRIEGRRRQIERFDALSNSALIPLVSERLAALLVETCPDDVQLIPATVYTQDAEIATYSIVNAVQMVRCIDHEASEYYFMKTCDEILGFEKLVQREGCLGNHYLAREAEYHSNLLASQAFYDTVVKHRMIGVGLYTADELYP